VIGGLADETTSPGWAAPAYDVLVIGAGLAGLTAAARLAICPLPRLEPSQ